MGCGEIVSEGNITWSEAKSALPRGLPSEYIDMGHELTTQSYKDHKISEMNRKFNAINIPLKLRARSESCQLDSEDKILPGNIKSARRLFEPEKYEVFEIFSQETE